MHSQTGPMAPEPIVQLGKLTRREFRTRMADGQLKACILPVAAVEQHLEHLAMEHDWRSVNLIAELIAQELAPEVLIAQGLMVGVSEHHMNHPGTLSLRPGTFLTVLDDLVDSMVRAGFQNILVLNGHGGNIIPCRSVWDQFLRRHQVNLQFFSYWDVLTEDDAREVLKSGHRLPEDLPGHAQEFETAFALAAFAENVRENVLNDQNDPTPSLATRQSGQEMIDRIVPRMTDFLSRMIRGEQVASVPAFHP